MSHATVAGTWLGQSTVSRSVHRVELPDPVFATRAVADGEPVWWAIDSENRVLLSRWRDQFTAAESVEVLEQKPVAHRRASIPSAVFDHYTQVDPRQPGIRFGATVHFILPARRSDRCQVVPAARLSAEDSRCGD